MDNQTCETPIGDELNGAKVVGARDELGSRGCANSNLANENISDNGSVSPLIPIIPGDPNLETGSDHVHEFRNESPFSLNGIGISPLPWESMIGGKQTAGGDDGDGRRSLLVAEAPPGHADSHVNPSVLADNGGKNDNLEEKEDKEVNEETSFGDKGGSNDDLAEEDDEAVDRENDNGGDDEDSESSGSSKRHESDPDYTGDSNQDDNEEMEDDDENIEDGGDENEDDDDNVQDDGDENEDDDLEDSDREGKKKKKRKAPSAMDGWTGEGGPPVVAVVDGTLACEVVKPCSGFRLNPRVDVTEMDDGTMVDVTRLLDNYNNDDCSPTVGKAAEPGHNKRHLKRVYAAVGLNDKMSRDVTSLVGLTAKSPFVREFLVREMGSNWVPSTPFQMFVAKEIKTRKESLFVKSIDYIYILGVEAEMNYLESLQTHSLQLYSYKDLQDGSRLNIFTVRFSTLWVPPKDNKVDDKKIKFLLLKRNLNDAASRCLTVIVKDAEGRLLFNPQAQPPDYRKEAKSFSQEINQAWTIHLVTMHVVGWIMFPDQAIGSCDDPTPWLRFSYEFFHAVTSAKEHYRLLECLIKVYFRDQQPHLAKLLQDCKKGPLKFRSSLESAAENIDPEEARDKIVAILDATSQNNVDLYYNGSITEKNAAAYMLLVFTTIYKYPVNCRDNMAKDTLESLLYLKNNPPQNLLRRERQRHKRLLMLGKYAPREDFDFVKKLDTTASRGDVGKSGGKVNGSGIGGAKTVPSPKRRRKCLPLRDSRWQSTETSSSLNHGNAAEPQIVETADDTPAEGGSGKIDAMSQDKDQLSESRSTRGVTLLSPSNPCEPVVPKNNDSGKGTWGLVPVLPVDYQEDDSMLIVDTTIPAGFDFEAARQLLVNNHLRTIPAFISYLRHAAGGSAWEKRQRQILRYDTENYGQVLIPLGAMDLIFFRKVDLNTHDVVLSSAAGSSMTFGKDVSHVWLAESDPVVRGTRDYLVARSHHEQFLTRFRQHEMDKSFDLDEILHYISEHGRTDGTRDNSFGIRHVLAPMRVTIGAANHNYATSQPDKCKTAWKFLKDVPRYMNGLADMDEFSPKLLSLVARLTDFIQDVVDDILAEKEHISLSILRDDFIYQNFTKEFNDKLTAKRQRFHVWDLCCAPMASSALDTPGASSASLSNRHGDFLNGVKPGNDGSVTFSHFFFAKPIYMVLQERYDMDDEEEAKTLARALLGPSISDTPRLMRFYAIGYTRKSLEIFEDNESHCTELKDALRWHREKVDLDFHQYGGSFLEPFKMTFISTDETMEDVMVGGTPTKMWRLRRSYAKEIWASKGMTIIHKALGILRPVGMERKVEHLLVLALYMTNWDTFFSAGSAFLAKLTSLAGTPDLAGANLLLMMIDAMDEKYGENKWKGGAQPRGRTTATNLRQTYSDGTVLDQATVSIRTFLQFLEDNAVISMLQFEQHLADMTKNIGGIGPFYGMNVGLYAAMVGYILKSNVHNGFLAFPVADLGSRRTMIEFLDKCQITCNASKFAKDVQSSTSTTLDPRMEKFCRLVMAFCGLDKRWSWYECIWCDCVGPNKDRCDSVEPGQRLFWFFRDNGVYVAKWKECCDPAESYRSVVNF